MENQMANPVQQRRNLEKLDPMLCKKKPKPKPKPKPPVQQQLIQPSQLYDSDS